MIKILFNKPHLIKDNNVKIYKSESGYTIENANDKPVKIISLKPVFMKSEFMEVEFNGKILYGSGAQVVFYNRFKAFVTSSDLNAYTVYAKGDQMKFLIYAIMIRQKTKVVINNVNIRFIERMPDRFVNEINEENLIITPSYPTDVNRYFGGFVHSRLVQYKNSGVHFSVACIHDYNCLSIYEYEGVKVVKGNFGLLDKILQKKFETIAVHFFDERYSQIFDRYDLSNSQLLLWVHGPETLYWDWNHFVTPYFNPINPVNSEQRAVFEKKDGIIKKYNSMPNVKWVFVSEWIKERSESLIAIKFKHYIVIPNIIDSSVFKREVKSEEKRKKIFTIRRFDNINKYAIDITVRTIVELSKREIFKNLEFYLYGEGDYYDQLIEPIKDFKNCFFIKKFLNHDSIYKAHCECGMALFPTRYDSQGVSMCEAAMSGLLIIGSEFGAVKEFLNEKYGTLSEIEDYKSYADKIEYFYNNPKQYVEVAKKMSDEICEHCSYDNTIKKEIMLFEKRQKFVENNLHSEEKIVNEKPLLTIIVPAYNVAKTIEGTLHSILVAKHTSLLEILIVNDGSKDNTGEVVGKYVVEHSQSNVMFKVINKENGGHGSTINEGIQKASGKYLKVIDGDDTVDKHGFERLLNKLEHVDCDVVLCDYYEDNVVNSSLIPKTLYTFMTPGYEYDMSDICKGVYGFNNYGPILATGTYKTSVLRDANFRLSEKCYYVDMEFNAYVLICCKTAVYFPEFVYKYKIGSDGQSISKNSFIKNYKDHEFITMNLISLVNNVKIDSDKKSFIEKSLIKPMVYSTYYIIIQYLSNRCEFLKFDEKLHQYPELYNQIGNREINISRRTFGMVLNLIKIKKALINYLLT